MNVTESDLKQISYSKTDEDKNKLIFEINLPLDFFYKIFYKQLKYLGKNLKVPGFRPGKLPENKIIELKGQEVLVNTYQQLSYYITDYIFSRESIQISKIIGYPEFKFPFSNTQEFLNKTEVNVSVEIVMTLYLLPKLNKDILKNIAFDSSFAQKKLEIENKNAIISDKEVLKVFQEIYSKHLNKEEIDLVNQYLDKKNDISFPQNILSKIGILSIDNLNQTLNDIKENLQLLKKIEKENEILKSIQTRLLDEYDFYIPESLIDSEFSYQKQNLVNKLKKMNLTLANYLKTLDQTEETFFLSMKNNISNELKTFFSYLSLSKEFNVDVSKDEISYYIDRFKVSDQVAKTEILINKTSRYILDFVMEESTKSINNQ